MTTNTGHKGDTLSYDPDRLTAGAGRASAFIIVVTLLAVLAFQLLVLVPAALFLARP